jgi:hypothetical protein
VALAAALPIERMCSTTNGVCDVQGLLRALEVSIGTCGVSYSARPTLVARRFVRGRTVGAYRLVVVGKLCDCIKGILRMLRVQRA